VRQSSMDDAFFLGNMLKSCRASLVADVRATLTACIIVWHSFDMHPLALIRTIVREGLFFLATLLVQL